MSGHTVAACVALLAFLTIAHTQDASINVEVSDRDSDEREEIEKRMTPELVRDLNSAKSDALLLYTEYTAKAGNDLKTFLTNISEYVNESRRAAQNRRVYDAPANCQTAYGDQLKIIERNAYRAASFSAENHHKFLLGHMVVFRMHLNETEEYIRKCERALYGCGVPCENKPKVRRWKRLALEEIHRVKDDLQHSRRSYKDLVAHAKRRLNHLRKEITTKTTDAVEDFYRCMDTHL